MKIFWIFLLSTTVAVVTAVPDVALLVPSYIRPSTIVRLHAQVEIADSDIDLHVALAREEKDKNIVVLSHVTAQLTSASLAIFMDLEVPPKLPKGIYYVDVNSTYENRTVKRHFPLRYKGKGFGVLIQTDKGIYKAGQTVMFRVIGVDITGRVVKMPMTIEIFDGGRNRIRRWADVEDSSGVFAGEMVMSEFPVLGTWRISATVNNVTDSTTFKVEEFVLPKFDVILEIPSIGSTKDNALVGKIVAKYTFGKTVIGNAVLSVQRYSSRKYEQKIKLEGETEFSILLTELKKALALSSLNFVRLNVKVVVTETATGISREDSATIQYYEFNLKIDFDNSNYYFKPGFPVQVTVLVKQQNGRPLEEPVVDPSIRLHVEGRYRRLIGTESNKRGGTINIYRREHFEYGDFPITENGTIPLEFSTDLDVNQLYVLCRLKKNSTTISTRSRYFNPFKSNSRTYLTLTATTKDMEVGRTVLFKATSNREFNRLGMQIMSKGIAIKSKILTVADATTSTEFSVKLTEVMAPKSVLIAWLFVARELVPAHLVLNIRSTSSANTEGVSSVSVKFSESKVRPDESVNLIVKAEPLSSAYVTVIDKSVLLLSEGNDITPSVISGLLKQDEIKISTSFTGDYRTSVQTASLQYALVDMALVPVTPEKPDRSRGFQTRTFRDSTTSTGPVPTTTGIVPTTTGPKTTSAAPSSLRKSTAPSTTKRTVFPDTWLFTNFSIGANGKGLISAEVPDTITSWVATAFVVTPSMSLQAAVAPATLGVFLPFFVRVQLPFSVIRFEQVILQASVFNFMEKDIYVIVTLHKSWKYKSLKVLKRAKRTRVEEACGNVQHCVFVKAGRATPVFFPIIPKELGQIDIKMSAESPGLKDIVVKKLRVESEGIPKEFNIPLLLDLKNSSFLDEKINLEFPPNVVEDSKRMKLSVVGDIMGPTVDGLESLVRMPYGCGEQNMVSFAPSVFVTKYLTAVDRLTTKIQLRALQFMTIGVQRQLRYQHFDGSYSAFGEGDKSGSTWLTSFVVKVFSLASPYIDLQAALITDPLMWLTEQQNRDGSFREPGHVSNRNMQGQSINSDRNLAAYVLIALLQGKIAAGASAKNVGILFIHRRMHRLQYKTIFLDILNRNHIVRLTNSSSQTLEEVIGKAVKFLEKDLKKEEKVYSLAISCYALKLAGSKSADVALKILEKKAVLSGGSKHWELGDAEKVSRFHYGFTARSADIEMTAYVLLAYALYEDLVNGALVNRWLVSQRNPHGGFISTQDTVIGLEGLAEINAGFKDRKTDMKIHVSWFDEKVHKHTFNVNEENAMVLQIVDVSVDTQSMIIHAIGKKDSQSLLQVSLFYNINMDLERQSFAVNITVEKETVNGFTVKACVRWLEKEKSAMTVMEIGVPSGFEANLWSISSHPLLKRSEVGFRKVNLYLDEVTSKEVCIRVGMTRDTLVADVKPVASRVYEYYEPSNQVTVFYTPLTLKHARICDICGIECGCEENKTLTFPKKWCFKKAKSDV